MSKSKDKLLKGKSSPEVEMTFLEHLEELRWRILYALIGLVFGTIVAWIFIDLLVDYVLLIPAKTANIKLQNLRPFGQLFLYFQIAIIAGLILSLPNVFYQFWKFISPALKEKEKKYVTSIVIFSTFCFVTGVVFAYFVMLPTALNFAVSFGSDSIENNFAITEYMSIIVSVMLGAGVVFELPMLSFFLSKIGMINPAMMKKYRRHAIIAILFVAAVITPTVDPVGQLMLAVPLVFLYEISIFVSKISRKKN